MRISPQRITHRIRPGYLVAGRRSHLPCPLRATASAALITSSFVSWGS